MAQEVTNVVFAGIGGQGVLRASDIFASAAFYAGLDVKKAEIHGMSQRGGSVTSDVRIGTGVLSPMIPAGKGDIMVILEETQLEPNRSQLREDGILITPDAIDVENLANKRSFNVAMLGVLSTHLPQITDEQWKKAICEHLPEKLHEVNMEAFSLGQAAGKA